MDSGLNFAPQREIVYNKFLPYSKSLEREALDLLLKIKANLSRSLLLSDQNTIGHWIHELLKFLHLFGWRFSRRDHLFFVRLLFQVIKIPNIELTILAKAFNVLTELLKKHRLLSRDDLTLEWRPLYDLYESLQNSSEATYGLIHVSASIRTSLLQLIIVSRVYFPIESTQEMLDEWRPWLCPYDSKIGWAFLYFDLFLPTLTKADEHDKGFKLWLEELMTIWDLTQNSVEWASNLVSIFSRLAHEAIGSVDWTPWVLKLFTLLTRSFNMSGGLSSSHNSFDTKDVSVWIVSMLGGPNSSLVQTQLEHFFKSSESYFHPSNQGIWTPKLFSFLATLTVEMTERLHREQHAKESWKPLVPQTHRLTATEVTKFVTCLLPATMIGLFSSAGGPLAMIALKYLSFLRPNLVIPPLLEKLYSSLELLTEPHRFLTLMQALNKVAVNLVNGHSLYKEGQTKVIPLLIAILPGIDFNDFVKCAYTLKLITTCASLVPFVDCLEAVKLFPDLTATEKELCSQTVRFEEFVLKFLEKCFAFVENSRSEERTEGDVDDCPNAEESVSDAFFHQAIGTVLTQCSPQLYEKAIAKIYGFLSNRIIETKVAGVLATSFFDSFSFINTEVTLQKFVPEFSRVILSLTEDETVFSEQELDPQLLSSLHMFSSIEYGGHFLLSYKQEIAKVLERTSRLSSKKGYTYGALLLDNTLEALTTCYPKSFQTLAKPWTGRREELPIHFWGKCESIESVAIEWHVPNADELAFAKSLVETFLFEPTAKLVAWTLQATESMSREEVLRNLAFISRTISGASCAFPPIPGDNCTPIETLVGFNDLRVGDIRTPPITFSFCSNVREFMVQKMRLILKHILVVREDDTKCLVVMMVILNKLLFFFGYPVSAVVASRGVYQSIKNTVANPLTKNKRHPRVLHLVRILHQHRVLVINKSKTPFSALHREVMKDLLTLSTSHYKKVRLEGQEVLESICLYFDFSYREVVPLLSQYLKKGSREPYERLKGALYVILKLDLITATDWETVSSVWLAIIGMPHTERQGIIRVLDSIKTVILNRYQTRSLTLKVTDSSKQLAKSCWNSENGIVPQAVGCPSQEQIETGSIVCQKLNLLNNVMYAELVSSLIEDIEKGQLNWKYHELAFSFLIDLIRFDVSIGVNAVTLITTHLISDSLVIRKKCIQAMGRILRQQKLPHPKFLLTDFPHENNKWLQYNNKLDYTRKEVWESTVFVEKPFWGFYCWPKQGLTVYRPQNEQPNVNRTRGQLTDEERPIYDSFCDQSFVDKLVAYLSLEERKGSDHFNSLRLRMFKGLFRNFGPTFVPKFVGHLRSFVGDHRESHQRFSAEILAGLIRGSKHWPYKEAMDAKGLLAPILRGVFKAMTIETFKDWGTCSSSCFSNRDARKLSWFVDLVREANVQNSSQMSSFHVKCQLYFLLGVLQQQEWRAIDLWRDQVTITCDRQYLSQSLLNVRQQVSTVLCMMFEFEESIPSLAGTLTEAPKSCPFIERFLPKLKSSLTPDEAAVNQEGHSIAEDSPRVKEAKNIFKTLCLWISKSIVSNSSSVKVGFYQLLPFMFEVLHETRDVQLKDVANACASHMSHLYLTPEYAQITLTTCQELLSSKSWRIRAAIANYIRFMVATNLFTLDIIKADIVAIVFALLKDKRVEVRESASVALSGLFHSQFLRIDANLLQQFTKKCKTELKKEPRESNKFLAPAYNEDALIERHYGLLGLCAAINAYPYDVPSFMPRVLSLLRQHENDPSPLSKTVEKTLANFRRTHQDSWREHKDKFTGQQLADINDILASANYYA